MQNNPLASYYRQYKKFVKLLGSTGEYTLPGAVQYKSENKEIGVMPMTSADEILLKTPDALLNGEAIAEVIKSCSPSVKQPLKLLTVDINLLLATIYCVSETKEYAVSAKCPACHEENEFSLDLNSLIDAVEPLPPKTCVKLKNDLNIYVRPVIYADTLKALSLQFEEAKLSSLFENSNMSDEEKSNEISKIVMKTADLKTRILANCIIKIVNEDPENTFCVSDSTTIYDFVKNISKADAEKIQNKIDELDKYGLSSTQTATCAKCQHNWETTLAFDPTVFFTDT